MQKQKQNLNPDYYESLPIPRRLLDEQHDSPRAIGIYILLARQHLISGEAVPLSANDLVRFDPSLSRGAVVRALNRLHEGQWVQREQKKRGQKMHYTPTWGTVKPKRGNAGADTEDTAEVKPWVAGAKALGRPNHIRTVRVAKSLLDEDIGRIAPNAAGTARITRHEGERRGSLEQVGLAALGEVRPQPGERQRGRGVPPPAATAATTPITPTAAATATPIIPHAEAAPRDAAGTPTASPVASQAPAQAYSFLVLLGVIGQVYALLIGLVYAYLIATSTRLERRIAAVQSGSQGDRPAAAGRKGTPANQVEKGETFPTHHPGSENRSVDSPSSGEQTVSETVSESESSLLLKAANVSARVAAELAHLPAAQVHAAIREASDRPGVRNKAAYVVAVLRNQQQQQAPEQKHKPEDAAPSDFWHAVQKAADRQHEEWCKTVAAHPIFATFHEQDQPARVPAPAPAPAPAPMTPTDIWQVARESLRERIVQSDYEALFRHARLVYLDKEKAVLGVFEREQKEAIETRYISLLRMVLGKAAGVQQVAITLVARK